MKKQKVFKKANSLLKFLGEEKVEEEIKINEKEEELSESPSKKSDQINDLQNSLAMYKKKVEEIEIQLENLTEIQKKLDQTKEQLHLLRQTFQQF